MTIAQLEALLREHCPEYQIALVEQGRASVTNAIDDPHRNRVGSDVMTDWSYWDSTRSCAGCGQLFDRHGTRRTYHSNACKQAAYRKRKKAEQQTVERFRKSAAAG